MRLALLSSGVADAINMFLRSGPSTIHASNAENAFDEKWKMKPRSFVPEGLKRCDVLSFISCDALGQLMLTRACPPQANTLGETLRKFAISLAAAACVVAPSALAPPEVGIASSLARQSCVPLYTHAAVIEVKGNCKSC